MAASRIQYSKDQLDQYYARVNLFDGMPEDEVWSLGRLDLLKRLQRHQMAHVPFEDLYLHYSQHHAIVIDPQALFHKIVERKRGGYCMENNTLFATVLRSMGYSLVTAGARVCKPRPADSDEDVYGGWSHMVNIVLVDGKKYMVDVGFGPDGPTQPMLLEDGYSCSGAALATLRLQWTNIPRNTDPSQRLWILQYRRGHESPWATDYCFTELEFVPEDYALMNYATSTLRTVIFTYKLICTRTILEGDDVVGVLILVDKELKRRRGGETETLMTFETERQRVDALKEWFGISLTDEEQRGIKGLVTQLKWTDNSLPF